MAWPPMTGRGRPAGFLDQAREHQSGRDIRDSVLRLLQVTGSTHPFAELRAVELQQGAAGPQCRVMLGGDHLRRADEPCTPVARDVREAARSHTRSYTTSSDPLVGLVGRIGSSRWQGPRTEHGPDGPDETNGDER